MLRSVFIALTLFLIAPDANATTVLAFDTDQMIARSERIFHGVCTDVFVAYDDKGRIVTHYSFMVTQTLKGEHQAQVTFTLPGGSKGGRTTLIPGLSQHRLGHEIVLFLGAKDARSPFQYPVGLDQGLYRVKTEVDGSKRVKRSLHGLHLVKGSTQSTTSLPENLPLAEFKSVLASRIRSQREGTTTAAPARPKKPTTPKGTQTPKGPQNPNGTGKPR